MDLHRSRNKKPLGFTETRQPKLKRSNRNDKHSPLILHLKSDNPKHSNSGLTPEVTRRLQRGRRGTGVAVRAPAIAPLTSPINLPAGTLVLAPGVSRGQARIKAATRSLSVRRRRLEGKKVPAGTDGRHFARRFHLCVWVGVGKGGADEMF